MPKFGLRTYINQLLVVKLNFLLWGWNWVCAAMVKEWHNGSALDDERLCDNPTIWIIKYWAKVLGQCVEKDEDYTFHSDSVKDDIALALPSAEADKLEDEIEERPKKKRKLQRVTISEIIDQRAGLRVRRSIPTKMRSANVRALSKMKSRWLQIEKKGEEQGGDTEVETSSQSLSPSEQPFVTLTEDKKPSGKKTSDVPAKLAETAVEPIDQVVTYRSSGGGRGEYHCGATGDACGS
ncbi:hypothetical protein AXG93_2062s1010 [Marchantia polymorpha subsp. ruderalis]|uniref:Uncharacterized protein n=1 Tax=Marchantia polymorpha subsp. ruderalis TaxID=1480154 RepID=A0A176VE49_MARPO|nr:hypothetical protein AXG93_2062s1010 [Marchantia polymorpha subsp. ruderalis]